MTREDQFDIFWKAYPRRVAKGHARDAFDKAIRKTTLEKMLDAIGDYIRFKPERIDFKHPATWLRAESWDDEWRASQQGRPRQAHNEILDAIIRGENVSSGRNTDIDASYERTDSGGSTGPIRLYALPSGRR